MTANRSSQTHQGRSGLLRAACSGIVIAAALAGPSSADSTKGTARAAMALFADHCFSPFMTADKAAKTFALSGTTYDFYDLDPFSSASSSPVTGRAATPGTDRRCEIAFPGDYARKASIVVAEALDAEGITTPAPLPARFDATPGTTLLAARRLNPRRVAIVHVGTREGAQRLETFMLVERLTPSSPTN